MLIWKHYSKLFESPCGIPQVSVLGPTLVLIYINDIVCNFPSIKFSFFADDTSLFIKKSNGKNLRPVPSAVIKDVTDWFTALKLFIINISKTQSIFFSFSQNREEDNELDEEPISFTDSSKFLGRRSKTELGNPYQSS